MVKAIMMKRRIVVTVKNYGGDGYALIEDYIFLFLDLRFVLNTHRPTAFFRSVYLIWQLFVHQLPQQLYEIPEAISGNQKFLFLPFNTKDPINFC